MSHFVVAVILPEECKDIEDVPGYLEDILAPYNEQPHTGSKYVEWSDHTDEIARDFEKAIEENMAFDDGTLFSDKYKDLDSYAKDYFGYSEIPGEKGRYGYEDNPNAKWDWWVIGGRWKGYFYVKNTENAMVGEMGVPEMVSREHHPEDASKWELDPNQADVALLKDVDWEYEGKKFYEEHSDNIRALSVAIRKSGLLHVIKQINASGITAPLREEYQRLSKTIPDFTRYFGYFSTKEKVVMCAEDVEAYLEQRVKYYSIPGRILHDDGWEEEGNMGWFGMDGSTEESKREFSDRAMQIFSIPRYQERFIVSVDCHI